MLFRNERWARLLIEIIYRYRERGIYQLHLFVIMPDHFHAIITPATTLERAMQYIKGSFSREAKQKLNWRFPIWQKSFTDHRVRDAEDCDNHIQYIYLNPVRKHLCQKPSEYPYSSAYPGFELDELPPRLKPGWLAALDGTADSRAPSKSGSSIRPAKNGLLDSPDCGGRVETVFPHVRRAHTNDLPAILEIEVASPAAAHWTNSQYEQIITGEEHLFLVAEESSRILGFLVASTQTSEWELENIAVALDARRHGVGRALMNALLQHGQQAGATEIRQEIRRSNLAAQQLGRSVGFRQQGLRRDYYRDPQEDALLFNYLLDKPENR